jgi:hypothetical protein
MLFSFADIFYFVKGWITSNLVDIYLGVLFEKKKTLASLKGK